MGLAYLMYAVLGSYALVSSLSARLWGLHLLVANLRKQPYEAPQSSKSIADVFHLNRNHQYPNNDTSAEPRTNVGGVIVFFICIVS